MEVNPPMIWFMRVQINTNNELRLKMLCGMPSHSWFPMFLLKIKLRLFLEKPSLVRKLAKLGKYFLGQPLGSWSNTNLDE